MTAAVSLVLTLMVAIYSNALVLWSEFYSYCIDVVVLGVGFLVIYIERKGKNITFEFGLGKIEAAVGILLAFLIFIYGIIVIISAAHRIMHPVVVTSIGYAAFLYIAITIKDLYLLLRLRLFEKINDSAIIVSQKSYYLTCVITDLIVLLPLFFAYIMKKNTLFPMVMDIIASLVICFITICLSYDAGKKSICDLIDKKLEKPYQILILKVLAKNYELYTQYHGQRTRQSAEIKYIDIFLGFPEEERWGEVLKKIETIRNDIQKSIPGSKVYIIPAKYKMKM